MSRGGGDYRNAFREGTVGGLYKLNPVHPQLESARFQPLSPSSEKPVSKICFPSIQLALSFHNFQL
jgi:hypothetical protein